VNRLRPVLLSGGAGTRLWPVSREQAPKQWAELTGPRTMLGETLDRMRRITDAPPMVLTNEVHRFGVAEVLRQRGERGSIVLEPCARSTGPALAVAALLSADDPDTIVLAAPTDHWIGDEAALATAVADAVAVAESGELVIFGVEPTTAHTGYGWIRGGDPLLGGRAFRVDAFAEKPELARAEALLREGGWRWNSGMLVFRPRDLLAELERLAPEVLAVARAAVARAIRDLDFFRLSEDFGQAPIAAFDTLVLERTARAAVVPLVAPWSDLGSWDALWEVSERDAEDNAVRGDAILSGVSGSLVRSDHRLVVAIDVADLVVVETPDAVLVCPRGAPERLKAVVGALKRAGRPEVSEHPVVHRPWGVSERVATGAGFAIKRLRVAPGEALSRQRHGHRAEHWVVVRGVAEVEVDGVLSRLGPNASIDIPVGAVHRLANPGVEPLEIVEVQTGSYLGEDDIERLEDRYGRL